MMLFFLGFFNGAKHFWSKENKIDNYNFNRNTIINFFCPGLLKFSFEFTPHQHLYFHSSLDQYDNMKMTTILVFKNQKGSGSY